MELLIIVVLLILNGIFSMSEAAVIASRRARLQQLADKGDAGAKTALKITDDPNRFLSTVQIGITLIGILLGAFGGATMASQIAALLADTPLAPYAGTIGFALIVLLTTYLSLIIGELVPKRLALRSPERIASLVAPPMRVLSRITAPVVTLLSVSTDAVLVVLGARELDEPPVTEEEIKGMLRQGVEAGVFEEAEHDMVEGIFSLGDRRIGTLMTPRTEVYWLDVNDPPEENRDKLLSSEFSRLPVCDDDPDHVLGMLHSKDLLAQLLSGKPLDIRAATTEALFVPMSMTASKVLDLFRETGKHIALVIGEYGGMEGLVSIQDILEEIVGEVEEEEHAVQRDDGSWLLDGMMSIDDFEEMFDIEEAPGAHEGYETLGGFMLSLLGNIPKAGDELDWESLHFEVLDMDGNRIDKVLITVTKTEPEPAETGASEDED